MPIGRVDKEGEEGRHRTFSCPICDGEVRFQPCEGWYHCFDCGEHFEDVEELREARRQYGYGTGD